MDDHPPFRSTHAQSELGRPSSPSPSPPLARASTLSSSLASYSFPGRLILPEPPSSHPEGRSELSISVGGSRSSLNMELPVPASRMGGRSVTPTQASASTSTHPQPMPLPRVVSGSQNLNSLLNHNHNHNRNDGSDDRVPSPRPRAHAQEHVTERYQTTINQMTGLPSPENSPPLHPYHPRHSLHPSPPRHHIREQQQHPSTHRMDRMDVKPFSNSDWAADERPVDSTRRRGKMSPVKDYHSASMAMSMPMSRSASNSRPQSSTGTGMGEVLVTVKEEQYEHDREQGQKEEQDELQEESPKKQKKRTRLNPEQGALLKKVWRETCFPSTERRSWLAEQTGLSVRQVQVWFQNQRQKQRNEEYEASKSFSADVPHPLSGPRVAFDAPIAPRDLPEKVYHAQGWSSIGPDPGPKRGSGDRPGTGSSSRPMTGEDRGHTSEGRTGSRSGSGSRPASGGGEEKEASKSRKQRGTEEMAPAATLPQSSGAPPPMRRTIWDQPPPYSAVHPIEHQQHNRALKRSREPDHVDPLDRDRPIKSYRPAGRSSESSPSRERQTPLVDRFPRLPSIRELGLNADRDLAMGMRVGMGGSGQGQTMHERGLPGIPGMMGMMSGPGRL